MKQKEGKKIHGITDEVSASFLAAPNLAGSQEEWIQFITGKRVLALEDKADEQKPPPTPEASFRLHQAN